jgi:hypothetical protein
MQAFNIERAGDNFVQSDINGISKDQDEKLLEVLEYINSVIDKQRFVHEESVIDWCAEH